MTRYAHFESSPDRIVHERLNHIAPNTLDHQVAKQVVNPLQEILYAYINTLSSRLPALCQPNSSDQSRKGTAARDKQEPEEIQATRDWHEYVGTEI